MKIAKTSGLILLLFALAVTSLSFGEEKATSGFDGEFVGQVHFVKGRILDLLDAFPEEKFSWEPAAGIRSVGDVFRHVTLANYYFIKFSGNDLPEGVNIDMKPEEWDAAVTDKAEIRKALVQSFDDLLAAAGKMNEQDLEKTVHVFGMDMSMRNFMISSLNHMHEHLGQAIAYARMNGVVPPWSK